MTVINFDNIKKSASTFLEDIQNAFENGMDRLAPAFDNMEELAKRVRESAERFLNRVRQGLPELFPEDDIDNVLQSTFSEVEMNEINPQFEFTDDCENPPESQPPVTIKNGELVYT